METDRFDGLTRTMGETANRRTALKALVAGVAGAAGLGLVARNASATGYTLTIHNAQCSPKEKSAKGGLYANCHENRVSCVSFKAMRKGWYRWIRTSSMGVGQANLAPGSYWIREKHATVSMTSGVYVYCSDPNAKGPLYDGWVKGGKWPLTISKGSRITCDVYNISTRDLDMVCPA